jgi:hypothetical protein
MPVHVRHPAGVSEDLHYAACVAGAADGLVGRFFSLNIRIRQLEGV